MNASIPSRKIACSTCRFYYSNGMEHWPVCRNPRLVGVEFDAETGVFSSSDKALQLVREEMCGIDDPIGYERRPSLIDRILLWIGLNH